MADTYHAIKLYKTTANSTISSKRVGINVTDSTVTTGYALYVNGAINVTDSLKTNSLNTGDLVVTGSASFTNGVNGITTANIPNLDASKITSGTLGVDRIPELAASKITSGTLGVDRIPSLSTDKLTSGTLGVARGGTGAGTFIANAILTGNGTSAIKTVATASGAAYATSANGALTFGKLPIAQGGTNATTAADARTQLGITPANIGAATSSHTHSYAGSSSAGGAATSANQLNSWATIGTSATAHATALQNYFDSNKSSIPRNKFIHFYDETGGNGSATFGYFLSGYDSSPYGGFYVAHYNNPYYVGILNGTYTQGLVLTNKNASTATSSIFNQAPSSSWVQLNTNGVKYWLFLFIGIPGSSTSYSSTVIPANMIGTDSSSPRSFIIADESQYHSFYLYKSSDGASVYIKNNNGSGGILAYGMFPQI